MRYPTPTASRAIRDPYSATIIHVPHSPDRGNTPPDVAPVGDSARRTQRGKKMTVYIVRRRTGAHRRTTSWQRGIDWFLYYWTGR